MAWNGSRIPSGIKSEDEILAAAATGVPMNRRNRAFIQLNTDASLGRIHRSALQNHSVLYIGLPVKAGLAASSSTSTTRAASISARNQPDYVVLRRRSGELNYYYFRGSDPKKSRGIHCVWSAVLALPPLWASATSNAAILLSRSPRPRSRHPIRAKKIPADVIYFRHRYQHAYPRSHNREISPLSNRYRPPSTPRLPPILITEPPHKQDQP